MAKAKGFPLIFAKKTRNIILDTLFPKNCLGCGKEGNWLCPSCFSETQLLDFQLCPYCEKNITRGGVPCPECKNLKKISLDCLIVAVPYDNPAVKKLVHYLKYRFVSDASVPLSELMVRSLVRNDCLIPDLVIPVPLHKRRLRWRGFNQSQVLAENISESLAPHLKIEVIDILRRKKYNKSQMEINNYGKRLENVRGIFSFNDQFKNNYLEKKVVLLVDDIATTGATLEECAKILKENGAKKVFAAVVARQAFYPAK